MSGGLKPCPFCGGEAETVSLFRTPPHGRTFVKCSSCGASGPAGQYGWAIAAWNTRATPAQPLDAATVERALDDRPAGWSWSLGEMMGLPPERRYRCFLSDHNTPDGKATRHVCEDRASPIEAIKAAIAEARALATEPHQHGGKGA